MFIVQHSTFNVQRFYKDRCQHYQCNTKHRALAGRGIITFNVERLMRMSHGKTLIV